MKPEPRCAHPCVYSAFASFDPSSFFPPDPLVQLGFRAVVRRNRTRCGNRRTTRRVPARICQRSPAAAITNMPPSSHPTSSGPERGRRPRVCGRLEDTPIESVCPSRFITRINKREYRCKCAPRAENMSRVADSAKPGPGQRRDRGGGWDAVVSGLLPSQHYILHARAYYTNSSMASA